MKKSALTTGIILTSAIIMFAACNKQVSYPSAGVNNGDRAIMTSQASSLTKTGYIGSSTLGDSAKAKKTNYTGGTSTSDSTRAAGTK